MAFYRPQPLSSLQGAVRHYYGDVVRALFIAIAIVIGIMVPLSADMQLAALMGIPTILALVILAGYTNPHGKTVLILDAVAAGMGIIAAEMFAVGAYASDAFYGFAAFEAISVLFLIALYYSIKNVRALALDKIGRIDGVGEFDRPTFVDEVKE